MSNNSGNLSIPLDNGLTRDTQIPGLLGGGRIGALLISIPSGATGILIHYDQEATGFPVVDGVAFLYPECGECRAVTFTADPFVGNMIVQVWRGNAAVLGTSIV